MWPLLFVLLVPADGYSSICSSPITRTCKEPRISLIPTPENENEFNNLCSVITEHVECLNTFDLACSGRSESQGLKPPLYYNRIRSFLDDVCKETGPLHNDLIRNLRCIKQRVIFSNVTCPAARRNVLDAYSIYLSAHSGSQSNVKGYGRLIRVKCLETVSTAACVLGTIREHCGFLSYEIAYSALIRTQILADLCELGVFQELSEVIDDLQLEKSLKEGLKKQFVVEIQ